MSSTFMTGRRRSLHSYRHPRLVGKLVRNETAFLGRPSPKCCQHLRHTDTGKNPRGTATFKQDKIWNMTLLCRRHMMYLTNRGWVQMLPAALVYKEPYSSKWKIRWKCLCAASLQASMVRGVELNREASVIVFLSTSLCFASCRRIDLMIAKQICVHIRVPVRVRFCGMCPFSCVYVIFCVHIHVHARVFVGVHKTKENIDFAMSWHCWVLTWRCQLYCWVSDPPDTTPPPTHSCQRGYKSCLGRERVASRVYGKSLFQFMPSSKSQLTLSLSQQKNNCLSLSL
jgi:hypothetical protein